MATREFNKENFDKVLEYVNAGAVRLKVENLTPEEYDAYKAFENNKDIECVGKAQDISKTKRGLHALLGLIDKDEVSGFYITYTYKGQERKLALSGDMAFDVARSALRVVKQNM